MSLTRPSLASAPMPTTPRTTSLSSWTRIGEMLPFLFAFIIPLTGVVGLSLRGPWLLATPVFVFVVTPILDAVSGLRVENPSDVVDWRARRVFDVPIWAFVPAELAFVVFALDTVGTAALTPIEFFGAALTVALVVGAAGITMAHELMHRPDRASQLGAEFLMTLASYPHFCIEHVLGHHKNVATPLDPACAREGETLYAYLPRTIMGGARSAWRLEGARVKRSSSTSLFADRRWRCALWLVAAYTVVFALFGAHGVFFFGVQSALAIVILESINYIEHYGLQRRRLDDGSYERVTPHHSWNSAHRLTGFYLFNLPRHADHHAVASRPYWALRHIDDSPQFPAGYATMLLLAFFPPLWRRVMDVRVNAWNERATDGAPVLS